MKIIGTKWNSDDLIEELLRDKVFFTTSNGGVTLSGGEATYQSEFATDIAIGLQESGVHVALDTCGYCSEQVLRELLDHVDMVLYDLKVMDPEKHKEFTGVSLDRVLSNALIVAESGIPVWIRTPIIPGHTDSDENIRSISQFIVSNMKNVERFDLLAFNRMCTDKYNLFDLEYPLKDADLITEETMERLAGIAREMGISQVAWSGMTKNSKISNTNDDLEEKPCAN
jgi:pyruvate formate lyase activating enzyme